MRSVLPIVLAAASMSVATMGSVRASAPPDIVLIQAPPQAAPPASSGKPGDLGPLLTPGIRPHKNDTAPDLPPDLKPDLKPDTPPDRKAEPKTPPSPPPKQAQPAPKPPAKPGDKPGVKPKDQAEAKAAPGKAAKPGLAVAQPRTAAERDKALSDLYALLATADDAKQAETVAASIEQLWVTSGSDTINLLMQRAMQAVDSKNPALALKLLDAVVALAPDYAEGWNRRAYVHYTQSEIDLALGDLRRTLALDQNHFKALDGLVHILQEIGRKKEALQAARRLLDVNPHYEGAKQITDELAREIEDRGI